MKYWHYEVSRVLTPLVRLELAPNVQLQDRSWNCGGAALFQCGIRTHLDLTGRWVEVAAGLEMLLARPWNSRLVVWTRTRL
jgi:hypothetical protein